MSRDKRKYKVLYIPGWFPTKEHPNAAIFVKEHIKAIALYNNVILLYLSLDKIDQFLKIDSPAIGISNVKAFEIKINKSLPPFVRKIVSLIALILMGWKVVNSYKIDLINTCSILSIAGMSAFVISKILRLPIVTNEHWSGYIRKNKMFQSLTIKTFGKFFLRNVTMICPVSRYLANAIELLGIKRKKISVIPNVVEFPENHLKPISLQKNIKTKRMLFIGLNFKVKGLDYILDALELIKDKREDFLLEVIGGIDEKELNFYKKIVQEKNLDKYVFFLGVKAKNEVSRYIDECDFGIQPSLFETFGISILEFLAKGKPVIVSDIPPINELVPQKYSILVPPKDSEALCSAIDRMLDTYYIYPSKEMSEYVRNNFSYENIGKLFTKVYSLIMPVRKDED